MEFESDELPNERAQHLLKALVERYIREGQPVGSRTLSKYAGLDISPATVRNVMSDLEELGFLGSPHTSAGRVPTQKGYRFFVDTLLKLKPLDSHEVNRLEQQFNAVRNAVLSSKALVTSTSTLLSGLTHLAGVVTVPRQPHAALRQIEFLPLSDNRVLSILVLNDKEVQNRILYLDRTFDAGQLRRAANYLNEKFAGRDLAQVREELVMELHETRESMNQTMLDAINMAQRVFSAENERVEYVLAGETNLMEFQELSSVEKLRKLFEAFNRQRDILHLLDLSLKAEGVQIFIGEESGYEILDECSVVTASYSVDGEVVGVLGVIGPTRMAYDRVIPIVDVTAKLLGSALKSGN